MATGRKLVPGDIGKLICRVYPPVQHHDCCYSVDTLTRLRAIVGDRLVVDHYTLGNCGIMTCMSSKKNSDDWVACETLHDAIWISLINYTIVYNRDPTLYRNSRCWYTGPLTDTNSFRLRLHDEVVLAYSFSVDRGLDYEVLSGVPAPDKTYAHLWLLIREEPVPRSHSLDSVDQLLEELNAPREEFEWDLMTSTITPTA